MNAIVHISKTELVNMLWLLNAESEENFEVFLRLAMDFLVAAEEIQNKLITQMLVRDEEEGRVLSEQDIAHSESIAIQVRDQGIKTLKEKLDDLKFLFSNAKVLQTILGAIKDREKKLKFDWLTSKGFSLEAPVAGHVTTVDTPQRDIAGQSSSAPVSLPAFAAPKPTPVPPPTFLQTSQYSRSNTSSIGYMDSRTDEDTPDVFEYLPCAWTSTDLGSVNVYQARLGEEIFIHLQCTEKNHIFPQQLALEYQENSERHFVYPLNQVDGSTMSRRLGLSELGSCGSWYSAPADVVKICIDPKNQFWNLLDGSNPKWKLEQTRALQENIDSFYIKAVDEVRQGRNWARFLDKIVRLSESPSYSVQWEIRFYLKIFLTNQSLRSNLFSKGLRDFLANITWLGDEIQSLLVKNANKNQ